MLNQIVCFFCFFHYFVVNAQDTIFETLRKSATMTELVKQLKASSKLTELLDDPGRQMTLFAPNNEAIRGRSGGMNSDIMKYHIIPSRKLSWDDMISHDSQFPETMMNNSVFVQLQAGKAKGQVLTIGLVPEGQHLEPIPEIIIGIRGHDMYNAILSPGVSCSNGIYYEIQHVLYFPKDKTTERITYAGASLFSEVFSDNHVKDQYDKTAGITAIIPSDRAAKSLAEIKKMNPEELKDYALSHLIEGVYYTSDFTSGTLKTKATNGKMANVVVKGDGRISVLGYQIIYGNILTHNGVIHIVDKIHIINDEFSGNDWVTVTIFPYLVTLLAVAAGTIPALSGLLPVLWVVIESLQHASIMENVAAMFPQNYRNFGSSLAFLNLLPKKHYPDEPAPPGSSQWTEQSKEVAFRKLLSFSPEETIRKSLLTGGGSFNIEIDAFYSTFQKYFLVLLALLLLVLIVIMILFLFRNRCECAGKLRQKVGWKLRWSPIMFFTRVTLLAYSALCFAAYRHYYLRFEANLGMDAETICAFVFIWSIPFGTAIVIKHGQRFQLLQQKTADRKSFLFAPIVDDKSHKMRYWPILHILKNHFIGFTLAIVAVYGNIAQCAVVIVIKTMYLIVYGCNDPYEAKHFFLTELICCIVRIFSIFFTLIFVILYPDAPQLMTAVIVCQLLLIFFVLANWVYKKIKEKNTPVQPEKMDKLDSLKQKLLNP